MTIRIKNEADGVVEESLISQEVASPGNGINVESGSVSRKEIEVYFVNINDKTESKHYTPITLACQGGHTNLVQLLASRGVDLNSRFSSIETEKDLRL